MSSSEEKSLEEGIHGRLLGGLRLELRLRLGGRLLSEEELKERLKKGERSYVELGRTVAGLAAGAGAAGG